MNAIIQDKTNKNSFLTFFQNFLFIYQVFFKESFLCYYKLFYNFLFSNRIFISITY